MLAFQQAEDLSRFWFPSFVPSDLPGFVLTTLEAASPQGPHDVMRRSGIDWYESEPETAPGSNLIIDDLLRDPNLSHSRVSSRPFIKSADTG